MMTAGEIENYIYGIVRKSELCKSLSGSVYFAGYRPPNSDKEDITISFSAGLPGQIQRGVLKLNIYVPDILVYKGGELKKDKSRTDELERKAQEWVESIEISDNFLFRLSRTIETYRDEELKQHFINITLDYKLFEV